MSSDEDEVNPVSHKKLLSEINDFVKFQHIKKPKRSEPSLKISEFHLVKSKAESDDEEVVRDHKRVSIQSLASTVRKNEGQKKIGNQLRAIFKKDKVLKRPLEKVHADRVQRTVAYDSARKKLSRWDAIVTKNKNAEQLRFPLTHEKVHFTINKNEPALSQFRYKTQMMKEIEEINNECFPKAAEEDNDEISGELLTLDEMKERRREMGRLKLKESQKIAKKRLQGKIKSKKYHRLRKREELKQKLREFEELKVSNPEAALKELEKIEKQRIQERANLRHKNTGTWAKNMKVRAQYDDTAKQELEAQLALGRELTQKNQKEDSSDSEDEEMVTTTTTGNPWLEVANQGDELDEIFSGYRKFWEEKNQAEKKTKALKKVEQVLEEVEEVPEESSGSDGENSENSQSGWVEEDLSEDDDDEDDSNFIEKIFDKAEEQAMRKVDSKLMSLKPKLLENLDTKANDKKKKNKNQQHDPKYLEFAKEARLADIDAALNEGNASDVEEEEIRPSKRLLKEINEIREEKKSFMRGTTDEIDPHSFLNVKSKHLLTAVPKTQEFDDIDEDELEDLSKSNKLSLAEAFENDDIINDFIEETEDTINKKEDVNAGLPGWGSWGGQNVKKKPKNEKPLPFKRKDRIIINNTPNEKLRKHLISSVPFPFTTVKDFEASMRLPVGKDFIPASAFRKITAPSVVTKAGQIIEPMTEDVLVQNNRKFNRKRNFKG